MNIWYIWYDFKKSVKGLLPKNFYKGIEEFLGADEVFHCLRYACFVFIYKFTQFCLHNHNINIHSQMYNKCCISWHIHMVYFRMWSHILVTIMPAICLYQFICLHSIESLIVMFTIIPSAAASPVIHFRCIRFPIRLFMSPTFALYSHTLSKIILFCSVATVWLHL